MAGTDVGVLMRCVNFSAIKHENQRRKNPEQTPYINHPVAVATILTEEAGIHDLAVIQAALLHDTVEDTDTTFEEIEAEFGSEICGIVREVTDDKNQSYIERKQAQIDHAPHASYKAKLVKLADKLHNLRSLNVSIPVGWSADRVMKYYEWSSAVVRGLRGTSEAMENELDKIFTDKNIRTD